MVLLMILHHPGPEHRVEVEHVIRRRGRHADNGSDRRNLVLEREPHRSSEATTDAVS